MLGLSPLHTGLTFLPMTLTIMLVASRAGRLVGRFGVRTVLGGGLLMLTAGLLLFARIGPSGSAIVYVMIPGLLTAAGIAMSIVPSTIVATQGAKEGQAGLASGLVNTSRQVGGGLGLALLITLATQRTTHLIGGGQQVPQALTEGFRLAYLIGAGLAGAAAVLTFTALPRPAAGAGRRRRRFAPGSAACWWCSWPSTSRSRAPTALRSAPTRPAAPTASSPSLSAPAGIRPRGTRRRALAPGYIFTANFYDLN